MGASLSKDKAKGALSGAMGAVIAETVAELASSSLMGSVEASAQEAAEAAGRTEVLPEDYESILSQNQEISASIGRFVSGATAVLTNQDVEVARQTSSNAVENNFLLTAAVIVGTVAFEMWKDANPEAWTSFKQSALEEITNITGLSESQVESGLKNAGVAYDVYNAISGKGLMKIGATQMSRQVKRAFAKAGGKIGRKVTLLKHWEKNKVGGRTVYKNNRAFDPHYYDSDTGMTNIQRMQKGRPPIGKDGKPVELHHVTQNETNGFNGKRGTLAEIEQSFHSKNYDTIHIYGRNHPEYKSWRKNNPKAVKEYDKFRKNYWKERVGDFE